MAHKQFKEYLEKQYERINHFPYILGEDKKDDLFSLETVILLNDMLDVQKQMLENLGKLLLKQEVIDKKLTDLQEKTAQISANLQSVKSDVQGIKNNNTQISTNLQNLKEDVQGIKSNNTQISNNVQNLNAKVQNIEETNYRTRESVVELERTLKSVTGGNWNACIRVENTN